MILKLGNLVKRFLENEKFRVNWARFGDTALDMARAAKQLALKA